MARDLTEKRHYMPFSGKRLRTIRKLRHLRQSDLAERVGMKQYRISEYETNKAEPMANALGEIATALQCSTDYLLEISENIEVNDLRSDEKALVDRMRHGDEDVRRAILNSVIYNSRSE